MAKVRSLESVQFSRYLCLCNVLRICNTRAIPTYRVTACGWGGLTAWFVAKCATGSGVACSVRPQLCNMHIAGIVYGIEYCQAVALMCAIGRLQTVTVTVPTGTGINLHCCFSYS